MTVESVITGAAPGGLLPTSFAWAGGPAGIAAPPRLRSEGPKPPDNTPPQGTYHDEAQAPQIATKRLTAVGLPHFRARQKPFRCAGWPC